MLAGFALFYPYASEMAQAQRDVAVDGTPGAGSSSLSECAAAEDAGCDSAFPNKREARLRRTRLRLSFYEGGCCGACRCG